MGTSPGARSRGPRPLSAGPVALSDELRTYGAVCTPEHYPADLLRSWKQTEPGDCERHLRSWTLRDERVRTVLAASAAGTVAVSIPMGMEER